MRTAVVQSAQSCYLVMPIERVIASIVRPRYKSTIPEDISSANIHTCIHIYIHTYIHTHMHSSWAHHPFNDDLNMELIIKILGCDIQSRPSNKHLQTS